VSEENLYRIVQVDPSAEGEVVDAAYRRLARKYHPDSGGDSADEERMRSLNRAYEVLSDPAKRRDYDSSLAPQRGPAATREVARDAPGPPTDWVWQDRSNTVRERAPVSPGDPSALAALEGATIRAQDGTYLGLISSDSWRADSICNLGGAHGSEDSETSIRNTGGKYGSRHSGVSAFSPYASKPPVVERDGRVLGYLTLNPLKQPAINPNDLLTQFSV
jgi:curved DNA-binding protein CbpA